jgi:dihydrofolate reductase
VAALKKEPGKDLWLFGGGELFRSFVDLGLVDGMEVAIVPVLLGGGLPMLPAGKVLLSKLTLSSHRVYEKTGTVLLHYAM